MNHHRTLQHRSVLAAITIIALLCPFAGPQGWTADSSDDATATATVDGPRFVGSASCMSTACHGAIAVPNTDATARREAIFWIERDPHARAAEALLTPLGQQMLEQLGIVRDGQLVDEPAYRNCTACHNLDPPSSQRVPAFTARNEGVSCEACHGAAEKWRDRHYRAGVTAARRAAWGMTNTKDVRVRAQLCIGCHVGADDRQVNHDLIAAGHPVLRFELAAYHAMYPKHWREPEGTAAQPLVLWRAGQIEGARATVRQLARRAGDVSAPWPEFAESNCFACHHDLAFPSWRGSRGFGNRPPGVTPLARWYLRMLPAAADAPENTDSLRDATRRLRETYEHSFIPDRDAIQAACRELLKAIDDLPVDSSTEPSHMANRLRALFDDPSSAWDERPSDDWDSAAQMYLALLACVRQERGDAGDSMPYTEALQTMRARLAFPEGVDSPRDFRGGGPTESGDSTAASGFEAQAARLLEQLGTAEKQP